MLRRGDPATTAILLLSGTVKVHTTATSGIDIVLAFCGPGDLVGETSAFRDWARSATAMAIEPVEGVEVPAAGWRAFLAERREATMALLDLALARLHVADARRMEFATSESLARVASRLTELAERFGTPGAEGTIDVALPITQEDLASWSASSRESTVRALRTLRTLGLVETSRLRFSVRDLDGLRAHAARL